MLEKLQQHIADQFPFLKESKLLIAISGGLDSVVLTQLLHSLGFDISLAHCNFNLRALESDTDETFVKNLGKELSLCTYTTRFDTKEYAKTHKTSTQIAARALRYAWFKELQEEHHFNYVATAHHLDDNLETLIINLSRGTGLEGLTGIPPINKTIVRPLLIFSRQEILDYAKAQHISWREDQSNASTKYVRNKIRHQIIPVLKEINPNLLDSFQKTSSYLQGSQQIIDESMCQIGKSISTTDRYGNLAFDIAKLKKLPNPKAYLFELLKSYNFTEWNDIVHLLQAQSGKQVFSESHRLLKDRDVLLLTKLSQPSALSIIEITEGTREVMIPVHLTFVKSFQIEESTSNTICLDSNKLTFPLTVRRWQQGDYFYPLGMQGKKKLSKFFKDEKYSLLDKENTWLLCSEHQIVWIIGKRQDRRFNANRDTTDFLKIHLHSHSLPAL